MKGPTGERTGGRVRSPLRRPPVRAPAAGGAVLPVLVLLLLPALGTTISAPYGGFAILTYNHFASGCAKARFPVYPTWNRTVGVGGVDIVASAKPCAPVTGLGGGGSTFDWGQVSMIVPVRLGNGAHSVQAVLNTTLSGKERLNVVGTCPAPVLNAQGSGYLACTSESQFYFQASAFLFDSTNQTYIGPTNYPPGVYNTTLRSNSTYCSRGSCSWGNSTGGAASSASFWSFSWGWFMNYTTNRSHRYYLEVSWSAGATAIFEGYPGGFAAASINLATLGNSVRLSSIVIT